jgi:hypothetical protein
MSTTGRRRTASPGCATATCGALWRTLLDQVPAPGQRGTPDKLSLRRLGRQLDRCLAAIEGGVILVAHSPA